MSSENNSEILAENEITGEYLIEQITNQIIQPVEKDKVKIKLYELGFLELFNLKKTSHDEAALDLYKKEYEIASTRFENIYKAIWQNFSYMSVVAGGLLTFGNNFFTATTNTNNKYLVTFLACVPLLFWYVSTFVPMNEYGYKAADQLSEIEGRINVLFNVQMNHFKDFKTRRNRVWDIFTKPSVRSMMLVFFIILSSIAFSSYINAFQLLPTIEVKQFIILVILAGFAVIIPILWWVWHKIKKLISPLLVWVLANNGNEGVEIKKQGIQTFIILFLITSGYFTYQYLIAGNVLWSLWLLGFLMASDIWIILLEIQRIYKRVIEPQ